LRNLYAGVSTDLGYGLVLLRVTSLLGVNPKPSFGFYSGFGCALGSELVSVDSAIGPVLAGPELCVSALRGGPLMFV